MQNKFKKATSEENKKLIARVVNIFTQGFL